MPRRKRIHYPGAFYHVTVRGNAKNRLFFNNTDRVKFCLLLQEGVERFGHVIHAFCLMDNHVHLLVQAGENPIGKAIQNVCFRFAMRLNKKFETTGHRFQGRYFSGLIDDESYLLEVIKYIHLNPIKARMVDHPGDYPWSSHNHYLLKETINWVEREFCLGMLSNDIQKAVQEYKSFFEEEQSEEIKAKIASSSNEYKIGEANLDRKILLPTETKVILDGVTAHDIIRSTCEYFDVGELEMVLYSRSERASFLRGVISFIALNNSKVSLASLAKITQKSASTLSRSSKSISLKIAENSELQLHIRAIVNRLSQLSASLHH